MAQSNIGKLPPPKFIEEKTFETILSEIEKDFSDEMPEINLNDSEPVRKILKRMAYREQLWRSHVQEAGEQTLFAFAKGINLDNVLSIFGERKPDESDESFVDRVMLAPDEYSTTGSREAYMYHAKNACADAKIKDVSAIVSAARTVLITCLSSIGNGKITDEQKNIIAKGLINPQIRPVHDKLQIESANIKYYKIDITITTKKTPETLLIQNEIIKNLQTYIYDNHYLGKSITYPSIYKALFVNGLNEIKIDIVILEKVENKDEYIEKNIVPLNEGLKCDLTEAPFCPISPDKYIIITKEIEDIKYLNEFM